MLDLPRTCCKVATVPHRKLSLADQIWRRLRQLSRRNRLFPAVTWLSAVLVVAMAILTWASLRGGQGLSAAGGVALLFANLVPAVVLMVLGGRVLAMRRAEKSAVGTNGRLHVRLVALFSLIATIPVVLMVLIASLLFQYGVDIWYSKRAQGMFENTTALAQQL
ncbi:MAG: hypothetical protein EBT84_05890, partial [Sphingomonadaceae bacterium]|nr:hypothetical protein [Sphingomonadaceae bacterium]